MRPAPLGGDADAVRRLETRIHGRYLVRAADSGGAAPLVLGFHGYGEAADAHLEELERVPGIDAWHRVALQGLHRFYTRSGEVVASWMTRQDRELAIADNVAWVVAVLAAVREELAVEGPVVITGFSQGTAMAWRAAALAVAGCDGVVALAGDVPPELAEAEWRSTPRALLGRGSEEAWYSEEKLAADVDLLADQGIEAEVCRFEGGHEWTDPFRKAVADFLRTLRQR